MPGAGVSSAGFGPAFPGERGRREAEARSPPRSPSARTAEWRWQRVVGRWDQAASAQARSGNPAFGSGAQVLPPLRSSPGWRASETICICQVVPHL